MQWVLLNAARCAEAIDLGDERDNSCPEIGLDPISGPDSKRRPGGRLTDCERPTACLRLAASRAGANPREASSALSADPRIGAVISDQQGLAKNCLSLAMCDRSEEFYSRVPQQVLHFFEIAFKL